MKRRFTQYLTQATVKIVDLSNNEVVLEDKTVWLEKGKPSKLIDEQCLEQLLHSSPPDQSLVNIDWGEQCKKLEYVIEAEDLKVSVNEMKINLN